MRRQPQSGPRKYKRRRKLKHEAPTFSARINEYVDMIDGITDSDENMKRKGNKKTKRANVEEGYQNVLKSFESSLQNINSIVSNSKTYPSKTKTPKKKKVKEEKKVGGVSMAAVFDLPAVNPPGRPKMIHTQKTRVPVEMGTDGVKKGQKTKTLVTRTPKVMPNDQQQPATRVQNIITGGERNRPRTKNVSYHVEGRQQFIPATFAKPKEMGMETEPQSIEMVNIKVEPGLLKLPMQFSTNNNGDILNLKQEQVENKPSPKKRGPVKKTKRRQSAVARKPKEKMDLLSSEIPLADTSVNMEQQVVESQQVVQDESTPPTQPMFDSSVVDGNNLEVAFEANIVSEHEETVQESILPDLEKEANHVDEMGTGNVKLSVKVESTPDGILDVHSLIGSVEESVPETIIPDTLEYTCEMCSAVFSTRAELLVHVPIHI